MSRTTISVTSCSVGSTYRLIGGYFSKSSPERKWEWTLERLCGTSLVMVEIEAIPVEVLDSELPQPPGLLFQGVHDVCSGRCQLGVRGVDIFREDPMDGRCERRPRAAEEDHALSPGDGPDLLVRIEPADLEAESVAIVVLCSLDV